MYEVYKKGPKAQAKGVTQDVSNWSKEKKEYELKKDVHLREETL